MPKTEGTVTAAGTETTCRPSENDVTNKCGIGELSGALRISRRETLLRGKTIDFDCSDGSVKARVGTICHISRFVAWAAVFDRSVPEKRGSTHPDVRRKRRLGLDSAPLADMFGPAQLDRVALIAPLTEDCDSHDS